MLADRIGAPDPCTHCHAEKSAAWADRQIAKRFDRRTDHEYADAFFAARHQQRGAETSLVELVAAGTAPAIVRATALLELRDLQSRALPALLMRASNDASPIVRRSVAVAARELPPQMRFEIVSGLLRDRARSVRVEAASALLGIDDRDWKASDREAFAEAKLEYEEARAFSADRGDGLADLAHVAALEGDSVKAEELLREAMSVDPTFTAAYVNLADLYRSLGRHEDSEKLLRDARARAADQAAVEHALGLAQVRLGRHQEAIVHLERAYDLRPENLRFGYVLAIAQFDLGRPKAALQTLDAIHARYPANPQILGLLRDYNRRLGREKAANHYAAELETLGGSRGNDPGR
jgi:tetratricopeptide (TPR) repeat protein